MGADICAFIQIDDNTLADEPAFTSDPSTWDLSEDWGLVGNKHYRFYAAIAGVRNENGIVPLFPCRGLPPRISSRIREQISTDDPNVSWLTLSEIHQALSHMNISIESLDESVRLVLRTMQTAEELFGIGRTRLVFRISD
jgi:hypothetical protein